MRNSFATFVVATLFLALAVPVAEATPTEVNVRVEGRTETLFEGPLLTEGHNVKATGDTKAPAAGRRCNGLNNNAHATPGPTPTAAGADAMAILGEGFDGDWYAEPFEDYFITQWGPDRQSAANAEYWGVIVNNVFTNVGGCQYQLHAGDEALWAYDAFNSRPRLALYPGDYSGGPVRLTAEAQVGTPFTVEVDAWDAYNEGVPPASPQRSTDPFADATVAPVATGPGGFEAVEVGSPEAKTTGPDGRAGFTFSTPGWHRLKATQFVAGVETVIRSNRLDVCVAATLGAGCGAPPADDLPRTPPGTDPGGETPGGETPGGGTPGGETPGGDGPKTQDPAASGGSGGGASALGSQPAPPLSAEPAAVRLRLADLDRAHLAEGLVGVSWKLLAGGVGVRGWKVSAQRIGQRGAHYVTRASGSSGSSVRLRLPAGAAYRLRLTVTDSLGRSSSASLGRVRVPG